MCVCIVRSLVAARMIISWSRLHPSPSTNLFLWESWLKPSEIKIIRPTKSIWMILTGTTQIPMSYFVKIWMKQQSILKLADPVPNRSAMGSVLVLIDSFSAHCWIVGFRLSASYVSMSTDQLDALLDWHCGYIQIFVPTTSADVYMYFFSFPTSDVYMMTWFLLEKPQGYSTNTSNRVIRCTAFLHPSSWSQ